TPGFLKAVAYVYTLQKRLRKEYLAKSNAYDEELAKWKAAEKQAKKDGSEIGPRPEEPVFQRVVVSDTTIEKLADTLEENPRGLLLARDELSGWLGSFKRYKSKEGGTDLPLWLEAHRAGCWIVDRKTG